jgi:cysteinyl-tRNA synthetase
VREGNAALDRSDRARAAVLAATVRELTGALGLALDAGSDDALDAATSALVQARDAARRARDWAAADAARDQLVAAGWVVEDTADGTKIRRA